MIRSKSALAVVVALACLLLAPAPESNAQPYDETESRNLATVQAGFDAWATGTGNPYDALADDATWEIVGHSLASGVYSGKESFLVECDQAVQRADVQPASPDDSRHLRGWGHRRVGFFDAEGTARDGVPYRNTYAWVLTLRDNRIVKASAFFDSIAFNDFWRRPV